VGAGTERASQFVQRRERVPGRTKLFLPGAERRNPVGLELGDDITADVDLDSVAFVDNDIKQLAGFSWRGCSAISGRGTSRTLSRAKQIG
jgi:hypothetical protein